MPIEISLSPLQLKQIASAISLKDIAEYIEKHQEEYEQYLLEEEKGHKKVNRTTRFKVYIFERNQR